MNCPMRKSKKQITDKAVLEAVIQDSQVCRMAMVDGDMPYIVPLNFGYRCGTLYFHCAHEGRKITIMQANPNVCLEFEANTCIITGENACDWSMRYQSVIAFGRVYPVEDDTQKRRALDIIMQHYSTRGGYSFPENRLAITAVYRVEIEHMTGKQSGM